jgi:hypothetical protein
VITAPPLLLLLLQASLFKLYELTAIASAACGAVDARLLELLAALAAEVSPGSSEHIFWARQYRWAGIQSVGSGYIRIHMVQQGLRCHCSIVKLYVLCGSLLCACLSCINQLGAAWVPHNFRLCRMIQLVCSASCQAYKRQRLVRNLLMLLCKHASAFLTVL